METEKYRVLIADDEAPARNKMQRLLEQFDTLELINVSSNGLDAYNNLLLLRPDIVFLDIEMPGMTGLEIIQNLPEDYTPHVVFATAYNDHAIKAFELNAIDYLLKPFNAERLAQALDKIMKSDPPTQVQRESGAVEVARELDMPEFSKIPVPAADRIKLIDYDEIVCLEVEEKVTYIYTLNKEYSINQPLETFEKKLPPSRFFRINRSCIINLQAIQEIVLWFGNRYKIVLINNKEVVSSREKSKALKSLLKF